MVAAVEEAGPGGLAHPSFATTQASLTEFAAGERAEPGRVGADAVNAAVRTVDGLTRAVVGLACDGARA